MREDGGRGLPRYYFLGLLFCCVAPRGGVTGRPELSPPYGNFFLSAGCNEIKIIGFTFNSVEDAAPEPDADPHPLVRGTGPRIPILPKCNGSPTPVFSL